MKPKSYINSDEEFKRLLRKVAVEKAPMGFTENVLNKIIAEKEPTKNPIWLRPKTWIILSVVMALGYLFIYQFEVSRSIIRNNFYLAVDMVQQYFQSINFNVIILQLLEWIKMLSVNLIDLISFNSLNSSLSENIIYLFPILFLILSQKLYEYLHLVKKFRV